jgi:hypothetical protein
MAQAGADITSLRLDPSRYLGLEYNKYKSAVYKLALTDAEKYYTLRSKVETELQTNAIKDLYDTIYKVLSEGTNDIRVDVGVKPNVSLQTINEICLSACETLNEIIQKEVLERLLPIDYNEIMNKRLAEKGQAKINGD